MATVLTSPLAAPNPFDLGIHTPANLPQGARAALLRNSSPVVNRTIGISPALGHPAQTSSPLTRMNRAATTEGLQPDLSSDLPSESGEYRPIDITESANQLANEQIKAYNAKLAVFRVFCEHFNEAARQFPSGPERNFAQHFSNSFLEFWKQALSDSNSAPMPTYSSILANAPALAPNSTLPPQQQQTRVTRLQGQPAAPAPPQQDLRVFIRLDEDAPTRSQNGYAIRTHIATKLGIELHKIPHAFHVNSGWAVRAADVPTRDLLVQRQSEWAEDLGANAIETSQKWYTYIVPNCPRTLTDLYGNTVTEYDAAVREEVAC